MSIENKFSILQLTGRVYICKPIFIENDSSILYAFGLDDLTLSRSHILSKLRGLHIGQQYGRYLQLQENL